MSALERRLEAYLLRVRDAFDWAQNNCCQWAARWVTEVEGIDPMAGAPATPTPFAARRLIRHLGGIEAAITHSLQRQPLPGVAFAAVGDVVLYQWSAARRRHLSVGLCNGRTSVLIDDAGATLHVSTLSCTHAWRVAPQ